MKRRDFAGAIEHGDAWRYFLERHHPGATDIVTVHERWKWFLNGWIAKGKQRVDVRR